ncbi:putative cytochrome P450 [Lyophyllum shimeji]|uniref:Cytochrome P450 n=1 Tax=Lyophyllum shimeji TaxID=47721 RepID=A0A9P3PQQ1_LYOSH|nr:putative cytochrome P450 [Lyophyllum shimeji]
MNSLILALIAFVAYMIVAFLALRSWSKLHIPAVGFEGSLLSYLSAIRFLREANVVLQEGYDKYKDCAFKVPLIDRWLVVVTGDVLSETLRSAPDNVLSAWEANRDLLQIDYTLDRRLLEDPYHMNIIRTTLNKNLGSLLPHMLDETAHAFETEIGTKLGKHEWTPIPARETFTQIVCQVSSRAFVGLPVCRNRDYCKLSIKFTTHVMAAAATINLFPRTMRPLVGFLYNKLSGHQARMYKLLGPEIEARKRRYLETGVDYADKPNDMLSWVMEAATPGTERATSALALRMLAINFMAIHTTYVAFAHTVYNLASQQHYLDVLRDEVESHLDLSNGPTHWTVEDLEGCVKLDSFIKESLRLNSLGAIALPRKALIPFQLPDGTMIPPGAILTVASGAVQRDSAHYDRAEEFDGLRFAKLREKAAARSSRTGCAREHDAMYRLTAAGPRFFAFGGGKHICPGRFFAALELKCMLVHLLLNYDVKTEVEGIRPLDDWMGPTSMPSSRAKILFRRRKTNQV